MELRLPASRSSGADPWKLHQQVHQFGSSKNGMPPILVYEDPDGLLEISDGVTRATRIAKLARLDVTRAWFPTHRIELVRLQDVGIMPEPDPVPSCIGIAVRRRVTGRAISAAAFHTLGGSLVSESNRPSDLFAALQELSEIAPEMRAGQLMAAVGELCADLHGRGL